MKLNVIAFCTLSCFLLFGCVSTSTERQRLYVQINNITDSTSLLDWANRAFPTIYFSKGDSSENPYNIGLYGTNRSCYSWRGSNYDYDCDISLEKFEESFSYYCTSYNSEYKVVVGDKRNKYKTAKKRNWLEKKQKTSSFGSDVYFVCADSEFTDNEDRGIDFTNNDKYPTAIVYRLSEIHLISSKEVNTTFRALLPENRYVSGMFEYLEESNNPASPDSKSLMMPIFASAFGIRKGGDNINLINHPFHRAGLMLEIRREEGEILIPFNNLVLLESDKYGPYEFSKSDALKSERWNILYTMSDSSSPESEILKLNVAASQLEILVASTYQYYRHSNVVALIDPYTSIEMWLSFDNPNSRAGYDTRKLMRLSREPWRFLDFEARTKILKEKFPKIPIIDD